MARVDTFTFRVNQDERQLLEKLSERLQRSQSDSVRWLIREAVKELNAAEPSLHTAEISNQGVRHADNT